MMTHDPAQHAPGSDEVRYFRRDDAPGIRVRLGVASLDLLVVLVVALSIVFVLALLLPPSGALNAIVTPACVTAGWLYLTVLKRTRVGTLGYWLAGLRIVDLHGRPPSLFRMTFRVLFGVICPVTPMVDLLWIASDDGRQPLRDRIAGTSVVRKTAVAGPGRLVYAPLFLITKAVMTCQVSPPTARAVQHGSSPAGIAGADRAPDPEGRT